MRERAHSLFVILFHSFFSRKRKHGRMGKDHQETLHKNEEERQRERERERDLFCIDVYVRVCIERKSKRQ